MITTSDFIPPLIIKIIRKVGIIFLRSQLKNYLSRMDEENILRNSSYALVGNAPADPTELYMHYDVFTYGFSEIKQSNYCVVFCHFYHRASTKK